MSRDAATRPLRWAVPLALSLAALALLLGLGFWQLDRKAWKEGLIAELNR